MKINMKLFFPMFNVKGNSLSKAKVIMTDGRVIFSIKTTERMGERNLKYTVAKFLQYMGS